MRHNLDLPRLGAVLADHREAHGLTLFQVGDRTGMALDYLSDVERGKIAPTLPALYQLADTYDIPVPVLLAQVEGLAVTRLQHEATRLAAIIWPDDRPGVPLADALIARLCEETGELAQAVRRHGRLRFGHGDEVSGTELDVLEELGDVLFLLARIADLAGVELGDAAVAVVEKIQRRMEAQGVA